MDWNELVETSPLSQPEYQTRVTHEFWKNQRLLSSRESVMLAHGYLHQTPQMAAMPQIEPSNDFYLNVVPELLCTPISFRLRLRRSSDISVQAARIKAARSHRDRAANLSTYELRIGDEPLPEAATVFTQEMFTAIGLNEAWVNKFFPGDTMLYNFTQQDINDIFATHIQMVPDEIENEKVVLRNQGRAAIGTRVYMVTVTWNGVVERPVKESNGAPLYFHESDEEPGGFYESKCYTDSISLLRFEFADDPQNHFLVPMLSTYESKAWRGKITAITCSAVCNYTQPEAPYHTLPSKELSRIGASPFIIGGAFKTGPHSWSFRMPEIKTVFIPHLKIDSATGNPTHEFTHRRPQGRHDRSIIRMTNVNPTSISARRNNTGTIGVHIHIGRSSMPSSNEIKVGNTNRPSVKGGSSAIRSQILTALSTSMVQGTINRKTFAKSHRASMKTAEEKRQKTLVFQQKEDERKITDGSNVWNRLQTQLSLKLQEVPTLHITFFLAFVITIPVRFLFYGYGYDSVEKIMKCVRMQDTDEVFNVYKHQLEQSLAITFGCTSREIAEILIGGYWSRNTDMKGRQEQGKRALRKIFPDVKETSVPNDFSLEQPVLVRKATHLAMRVHDLMHLFCGLKVETAEISYVNRSLGTSGNILSAKLAATLDSMSLEVRTEMIDKISGNNDPTTMIRATSIDSTFRRLAGLTDVPMQDESMFVYYTNMKGQFILPRTKLSALFSPHEFTNAFRNFTPAGNKVGPSEVTKMVSTATAADGSTVNVTSSSGAQTQKRQAFAGMSNIKKKDASKVGYGFRSLRRDPNISAAVTECRRTTNNQVSVQNPVLRRFRPSQVGVSGLMDTTHGKESGHTNSLAIFARFSDNPDLKLLTEFGDWVMAFLDEELSPGHEKDTWIVRFNGRMLGFCRTRIKDDINQVLRAIRSNTRTPLAFRQMCITEHPGYREFDVYVLGHRIVRPVLYVDPETQHPFLPVACYELFEQLRKVSPVEGLVEPWNDDYLMLCMKLFKLIEESGALYYMDIREMCSIRVCPNIASLGTTEDKYDVVELSPVHLFGFGEAAVPGLNSCVTSRGVGTMTAMRAAIGASSGVNEFASTKIHKLSTPQYPLRYTPFGHRDIESLPASISVVTAPIISRGDDMEDAKQVSKLGVALGMANYNTISVYTVNCWDNMRLAIDNLRAWRQQEPDTSIILQKSSAAFTGGLKQPQFRYYLPTKSMSLPTGQIADPEGVEDMRDHLMKHPTERDNITADSWLDEWGVIREGTVLVGKETLVRTVALTDNLFRSEFDDREQTTLPRSQLRYNRESVSDMKYGQVIRVKQTVKRNIRTITIHIAYCGEVGPGLKISNRAGSKGVFSAAMLHQQSPTLGIGMSPDTLTNPQSALTRLIPSETQEQLMSKIAATRTFPLASTQQPLNCVPPFQQSFISNTKADLSPSSGLPLEIIDALRESLDPLAGLDALTIPIQVAHKLFEKKQRIVSDIEYVPSSPLHSITSHIVHPIERKQQAYGRYMVPLIDLNKATVMANEHTAGAHWKVYYSFKDVSFQQLRQLQRALFLVNTISPYKLQSYTCTAPRSILQDDMRRKVMQINITTNPSYLQPWPRSGMVQGLGISQLEDFNSTNAFLFELKVSSDTPYPEWARPWLGASAAQPSVSLYQKLATDVTKHISPTGQRTLPVAADGRPRVHVPAATLRKSRTVFAGEFQWLPIGIQNLMSDNEYKQPPRVSDTSRLAVLCHLPPGHSIHIRFYAVSGNALSHGETFLPGSIVPRESVRLTVKPEITLDQALSVYRTCSMRDTQDDNVFSNPMPDIEDIKGSGKLEILRPWACSDCNMCYRHVDLTKPKDAGVVAVIESFDKGLDPNQILAMAIEVNRFEAFVKETETIG